MFGKILQAWREVTESAARGDTPPIPWQTKEADLRDRLRVAVRGVLPDVWPQQEVAVSRGRVDLVYRSQERILVVECKYKLISDGAATDNRTAAFFDIWKLENFIEREPTARGLFLWLTNNDAYLRRPGGASDDFSTHDGRIYEPGTVLRTSRARNRNIPLPMVLTRRYELRWRTLPKGWHTLEIPLNTPSRDGIGTTDPDE